MARSPQKITRRNLLKTSTALSTISIFSSSHYAIPKEPRRPNMVFIMADDLGYGDVGCYGCTDIRTPVLDQFAREGIRFTQYYANAPECTPTRTALLTGRYQQRIGGLECAIGTGHVGRYDDAIRLRQQNELGLPASEPTLAKLFKKTGYATAIIGKWHLGYDAKFNPLNHGFDYFFGTLSGGADYFHHTESTGGHYLYRNREPIKQKGYMTNLITREAVHYIQQQSPETPFFLYVPYTAPHSPYQAPTDPHDQPKKEDNWNQGSRETYAKMVECMDRGIGQILDALKNQGMDENTVVVFCSDNGGAKYANNGFLSKGKGTCFEGGIRVPCIIRWPEHISQGSITHQVAITMDLTASLTRIAGAKPASNRPFDGIDIIRELEMGGSEFKRTLFWRKRRGDQTWRAIRDGDLKYVSDQRSETVTEYLFNLAEDPEEQKNLIQIRKNDLWNLKNRLKAWEKEVKPIR